MAHFPGAFSATMFVVALGASAASCRIPAAEDPQQEPEALHNANFSVLQNNLPAGWTTLGVPASGRITVIGRGEIEIVIPIRGVVSLRQEVGIYSAGWYRFTGEVRTEDVEDAGGSGIGATLYVRVGKYSYLPLQSFRGTTGWRKVEVYFTAGRRDSTAMIACQLGRNDLPATGRAYFRNIHLTRLAGVPPGTAARFHGNLLGLEIFEAMPPPSWNSNWSVVLVFLMLPMIAAIGWWLLSPQVHPRGSSAPSLPR